MTKKTLLILLLLCFAAITVAAPMQNASGANAGAVTDTISIHIGYFGWEEDQFIEKVTYHWKELDDLFGGVLTSHEVVYSYYSGNRTYHAAGRGFYIRDLLEYAGVDFGSISRIDFFTRDQTIGAYRSFTKSSLFDMPRYYFPYLAADEEEGTIYAYHGGDLYDGATRVEAMLALEDITVWDNVGYMFEETYDRAMYSTGSRFHLFFGQLSPEDANTSSAAKYVYKLFLTFTGTPVLRTEETNIELLVGNNFRMIVNVSAEDALLDEYVSDNLIWTSDDESVVTVDAYGNLTVISEGEAVITASFGEASVSATVRAEAGDIEPESTLPDDGGGSGVGSGDGQGSGSGAGEGNGDGSASLLAADNEGKTDETIDDQIYARAQVPVTRELVGDSGITVHEESEIVIVDTASSIYLLSEELMSREEYAAWVRSVLGRDTTDSSNEGALSGSRSGGMGESAIQLILPISERKSYLLPVACALAVFFAIGFGYGTLSFKRRLVRV